MNESNRIKLTHPTFDEPTGPTFDDYLSAGNQKQGKIKQRQRSAAQMLLKSKGYPTAIKNKMKIAFDNGDFVSVQETAANYDIQSREELDAKISMIRNPDFRAMDVNDIQDEIEHDFFEKLSTDFDIDRLLKEGEEYSLRQKELESIQPHEVENTNFPVLFKAEGVDGSFTTASKAIQAYKESKGMQVDTESHKFRKTLVYTGDLELKIKELKEKIDDLNRKKGDSLYMRDVLEEFKSELADRQKELEAALKKVKEANEKDIK